MLGTANEVVVDHLLAFDSGVCALHQVLLLEGV